MRCIVLMLGFIVDEWILFNNLFEVGSLKWVLVLFSCSVVFNIKFKEFK